MILGSVNIQQFSVLFKRRELTGAVRNNSGEGGCVASVQSEEALLAVRSLDKPKCVPECVLDVFTKNINKFIYMR